MKKNFNKNNLIIIVGVLVVAVVAIVTVLLLNGNSGKNNNNNDVKTASFDEQNVEGLNISGFNLLYEKDMTSVLAIIKNTTDANIAVKNIVVSLQDADGKEVGTCFFYVDTELEPGVENVYSAYISGDVTNAKSVKYVINK